MRNVLDKKLHTISEIWNNYIWNYKICNSKIKFTDDVKSNYFGDILIYFSDTFDLIYNDKKSTTFSNNIEFYISFLQSIYIQQDFIKELLHIFKCDKEIKKIDKDANFKINRALRNELVGHPIRTIKNEKKLISSSIFSNLTNSEQIIYLRYHLDKNYKSEEIRHNKADILKRHSAFIDFHFDVIIEKLKGILLEFKTIIEKIENIIATESIDKIVEFVSSNFEYISKTNHLYEKDTLLDIYKLRNKNERYNCAIEMFLKDLNQYIYETKKNIDDIINEKPTFDIIEKNDEIKLPEVKLVSYNPKNQSFTKNTLHHYELSKLLDRNDLSMFIFFCSILKKEFKKNELIISEIENMEKNLDNTLEYYCSYYLIQRELSIFKNQHEN